MGKREFKDMLFEYEIEKGINSRFFGNIVMIPCCFAIYGLVYKSLWNFIYCVIAMGILWLIYRYTKSIIIDFIIALVFLSIWGFIGWTMGILLMSQNNVDGANYAGLMGGILWGYFLNSYFLKRIFRVRD